MAIVFWNFEGLIFAFVTATNEPRTCFIKLRPTRPDEMFARPCGCRSFAERISSAAEIMNMPSAHASMRYSGQCWRSAEEKVIY